MFKRLLTLSLTAIISFQTTSDLFQVLGVDRTTSKDKTEQSYKEIQSTYNELSKEYIYTELYNDAVTLTNSSKVSNEISSIQQNNEALKTSLYSAIDSNIEDIISMCNEYYSNTEKLNKLLNAMTSYNHITTAELPNKSLEDIQSALDKVKDEYTKENAKSELGMVKDMIQPIQSKLNILSAYGERMDKENKKEFHHGVDLKADEGTGVLAMFNGTVIYAGYDPVTGETVKISHGDSIVTVYESLQERYVKEGDIVKQYQKIGTVGTTSKEMTTPAVHIGLYVGDSSYDPCILFRKEKTDADSNNKN